MNPSNEIMWVHAVRVVSIFFVVWVHSAAQLFFFGAPFESYAWWMANIYDSSVRVCVPMLFMLSGYLLLGKSEPLNVFLKKRLHKVVVPLMIWSVFFILWINLYEYDHPSQASSMTLENLSKIHDAGWGALLVILWCSVYYHLWFLYVLLGIYLLMPLLRVMVQNASTTTLWYFVGLSIIASFILPGAEKLTGAKNFIHLNMASGTIGYFVLGYLLGNIKISRRMLNCLMLALIISTAITIVGTYYLTAMKHGVLDQAMWGETPNMLISSASFFPDHSICFRIYQAVRYQMAP